MLEFLSPGVSLCWDLLWQPCLFLGAGMGATLALHRRPARAHRILLLAVLASFITPLFCQAIRCAGLGVFDPRLESSAASSETPITLQVDSGAVTGKRAPQHLLPDQSLSRPADVERVAQLTSASLPSPTGSPIPRAGATQEPTAPQAIPSVSWRQTMLSLWLVFSGLATARLAASFLAGLRLVRRATLIADPALSEAARSATARMGLRIAPELCTSPQARCPSIWCWGRRPLLLIPEAGPNDRRDIDWVSVFCHELAHWQRADHLAALVGQVVGCVLPWNPLAWWAKSRLAQLGELACDDWVLASGLPGTDYAESLLALVPERGGNLALAAVSSRGGLVARVRHILTEHHENPVVGKRWGLITAAIMILAASAVALAQARPAATGSVPGEAAKTVVSPVSDDNPKNKETIKHTIRGTMLGPDGKPANDATVIWAGNRKPPVPYVALPKDDERGRKPEIATLARAQTDAQGRFSLSAEFDAAAYSRYNGIESIVMAMAPGAGMVSRNLIPSESVTEVSLQLPRQTLVSGRLLTPSGQPAAGVRVALSGFRNALKPEGMYVGLQKDDAGFPPYWPRSRTTGADGRFTVESVPQGHYATFSFWHPDFAVDEVTVNTTADGRISADLKGFEIVPVKPDFTYTLEPARPVQGRVTDKQTGKPLAGMAVEMVPMRRHGGMPFWSRTDADGRYRISGHQTDGTYYTTIYPPASSGYLDAKDLHEGWPAGAKFLEVNFALEKGRLVGGRVIDKDTKNPIAGAAVVYQPARKNANNTDTHDFRNTVLTDPEGKFLITVLSGEGILAVETPDENYVRTPTKDTSYARTAFPQGHVSIDVPSEGDPSPVEIPVQKGVTLEAKLIGPNGQIVKDVAAIYQGIDAKLIDVWNQGHDLADGILRIPGADPEKIYRVFFVKPQDRLGAVAKLKYDPGKPGPVEIQLQPTATVRGKLVNPGGSAVQRGQVMPMLIMAEVRKELSRDEMFNSDLAQFYTNVMAQSNFHFLNCETDSQGEFTFEAMIPGARFYVSASGGERSAIAAVPELKPGEVRDLGTITLKEDR